MNKIKQTIKNYIGPILLISVMTTGLPVTVFGQAYEGLTLINTMNNNTARLINNAGQTIKSWSCNTGVAYEPYLMSDSTMWRPGVYSGAVLRGAAYGGLIQQYSWSGSVIRSFIWSNSNHQQHHDIHPMSNGNVLVLSWDRKTQAQAVALGRQNLSGDIWPDEVVEYNPVNNQVVWEWHFWDHLIQDVDSTKPNYGVVAQHPELLDINIGVVQGGDWMHCNTVDYNEERDEIILTSHNLHEIYIIDHSTTTLEAASHIGGRHGKGGDFLYRWGNPQNYDRGTATNRVFYVAHGANWIRPSMPGAGNIIVLNNGDRSGSTNDYSVITEIMPPLDSFDHYYISADSAFGPVTPIWTYSNGSAFYAQHLGGAYRLPNGNSLAILGTANRLVEVNNSGQVVWQYNASGQIGRAMKYPLNFAASIYEDLAPKKLYSPINLSLQNPLHNSTNIKYTLKEKSHVNITVYNSVGQVVSNLFNGTNEIGIYTINFTPGLTIPTGIYLLKFEVEPATVIQNRKYVITRSVVKE